MNKSLSCALALMRCKRYHEAKKIFNILILDKNLLDVQRDCIKLNIKICENRIENGLGVAGEPISSVACGVIGPADRSKGLFRDAETVIWALSKDESINASALLVEYNLYSYAYDNLDVSFEVMQVNQGGDDISYEQSLGDWLSSLSVLMIFEALNPSLINIVKKFENIGQVLFIPNLEWAVLDPRLEDTEPWVEYLIREKDIILSLARTPHIYSRLKQLSVPVIGLNWSIPDAVVDRKYDGVNFNEKINVLMNAGNFGYKGRRGFDIFINAINSMKSPEVPIKIVIKCNKQFDYSDLLVDKNNVEISIISDFIDSRSELLDMYDAADIVVYPSRFEGFGISLLEALHRGCFVIATDGEPMSELVPNKNMLVKANNAGKLKLADVYEVHPQELSKRLDECISNFKIYQHSYAEFFIRRQSVFVNELCVLVKLMGR